ncbi:uncharacterized protein LOC119443895 [Dermacentor silvarum]|uniref:uncharacterized protein LOC119443895 n=1 Tax=Dermacentor silvarum TaxID=543639 RepID=UPI0021015238|nr:uncharacterized protein LOC119443895 [Dermacentor silvarum]
MSEDKEVKPVHGMFAVPAPPTFDFDRTSEWPSWIQLFDDYRFASGLNERSEEAQVRTLLYTMGKQAREIFSTFELSEQQQKQYEVVRKKFDDHFVAARNLVYESACFHRRIQQPGESVDQFITALHTQADRCDYKEKERMIRDRFVVGLSDAKLSESLQMDANLTLASALAKARLKETVQRQQQQLRETSDEPSAAPASNLDAINKQRQPRKNSSGQRSGTSSRTTAPITQGQRTRPQSYRPLTPSSCPNCGQGEHPRTSCPARAAKCNYCGCSGHFAVVCRKKAAGERKKEYKLFARNYGFRAVTSSPRYPQANGEVERMVQTIKGLITKAKDPYLSLLAYRDTPGLLGKSPAELLMGRRLRTTVPVRPTSLRPQTVNLRKFRSHDTTARQRQRRNFNRRHRATSLRPLEPGAEVWGKATVTDSIFRDCSKRLNSERRLLAKKNKKFFDVRHRSGPPTEDLSTPKAAQGTPDGSWPFEVNSRSLVSSISRDLIPSRQVPDFGQLGGVPEQGRRGREQLPLQHRHTGSAQQLRQWSAEATPLPGAIVPLRQPSSIATSHDIIKPLISRCDGIAEVD